MAKDTGLHLQTPEFLNHLPVVMGILRRTGILNLIDHAIADDRRSKVSTSECVAMMICMVFIGEHGMWRMRDHFRPYDMHTIMKDPEFDLSAFTEERLAKALDDLYRCGLDKLMTGLGLQVIEQFRIDTDFLHFDTTSLSFYGAYEGEGDLFSMSNGIDPAPSLTYGYAKNRRTDLKQLMFGALVSHDGGVPLCGKAMDGNQSDNISTAEFFQRVRGIVAHPKDVCCVADSKGWCSRVLHIVEQEGLRLLSRMPRTLKLHRTIMSRPFQPTERVLRPAPEPPAPVEGVFGYLPDELPPEPEYYDIQGFDDEDSYVIETMIHGKKKCREVIVPVRAVRVHSSALMHTKEKTLDRLREREQVKAKKQITYWQGMAYACESDALRALERQQHDTEFTTWDIHGTISRHEGPFKPGRGRPRKRPEPALQTSHYRIAYELTAAHHQTIAKRLRDQSSFIIVRTRTPGWTISDAEMVLRYKNQYLNEHGFAWLKSEAAINPMYLKTPRRIATLCFLYTVGLIVWTIIQREARKNLKKLKKGLPYHRNVPSDRITTRFLLPLFASMQTMVVGIDGKLEKRLFGDDKWTSLALSVLGIGNAVQPVMKKSVSE